jgi:TolB-like protein/tetratricopeptide (TPR) repeat protein
MIELRLLGSVSIDAPDHPRTAILAGQPKRLALLVYLAIALPRGFWRRDAILPLLWPNLGQGRARAALRKTLHHLRQALPEGAVVTRGTEDIALAGDLLSIDAVRFDSLLDCGSDEEALGLYRGDLMPGFHLTGCPDFVRWLDGERARLRRRAARATWLSVEEAAGGGSDGLPSVLQRALELNPLDEAGVRRAMQLLSTHGNVGGAIAAYEAFSSEVARSHGAVPAAETIGLYRQLVTEPDATERGTSESRSEAAARPTGPPMSLAVIPFVDMSPAGELEWFGDGLAEEIINRLVQAGGIHVAARTSSFAFKGTDTDVRDIGRSLDVRAVLEGSVRSDGGRYRITAQLIRVDDGFHLWSANFDPEATDLFAVQDALAVGIADRLLETPEDVPASDRPAVARERRDLVRRPEVSPEAYQEYLHGRHQLIRRTPVSLEKSATHFRRAVAIDSGFAAAYAGLAECYAISPVYTGMKAVDALPLATAAANKALSLDDSLADAHAAKAYASIAYEWDWSGGQRGYTKALDLDPGNARARAVYALYPLSCTGQHDLAIAEVERARGEDPLSLPVNSYVAYVHMFARSFQVAEEEAHKVVELDDDFPLGHWVMAATSHCVGDYQAAVEQYRRAVELTRGSPLMRTQLAAGLAGAGDRVEAEAILESLIGKEETGSLCPPYFHAMALAELGRADEAIEELRRAYRERAVHLIFLNVDARFDSLRADPRFRELVLRIGLTPRKA